MSLSYRLYEQTSCGFAAVVERRVQAVGESGPIELTELTIEVGEHRHGALAAGPEDGQLVLCLHGWPEFADSWTAELHALGAAGYRAVAVDQRGYAPGARPSGAGNYAIELLIADALAFARSQTRSQTRSQGRSQAGEPFHLLAHDWGGTVGWALASAHPERLRSLSVLATPHPRALQEMTRDDQDQHDRFDYVRFFRGPEGAAEAALLAGDAARLRAAYAGRVPAAQVERNLARLTEPGALTATLNWYRGATDDDFAVPAGQIQVPTLYLWGSEDGKLGRAAAEATAQYVDAEYRFEVLEGASHWLPEECPERVLPPLLEHLGRNS